MPFHLARRMIVGVLLLTLAMPALTLHVCRCTRQSEGVSATVDANAKTSLPLRPCCAKRLAAAKDKPSSQPSLKARCCCSEIRWNQTAAKVAPANSNALLPDVTLSLWNAETSLGQDAAVAAAGPRMGPVRAGPPLSALILHCRCQV